MLEKPLSLASITFDCKDAEAESAFWSQLLGISEAYANDDRTMIALEGKGFFLSFVADPGYVAPSWPTGTPGQQIHLDLYAGNLDADAASAVSLGASLASVQPNPEAWRVLLDPAGHPFCLMLPFDE